MKVSLKREHLLVGSVTIIVVLLVIFYSWKFGQVQEEIPEEEIYVAIPLCDNESGELKKPEIKKGAVTVVQGFNVTTVKNNSWMEKCCAIKNTSIRGLTLLDCDEGTPCFRRYCEVRAE